MVARKRSKYTVRKLTVADFAEADRLRKRVVVKRAEKVRVAERYDSFCRLNVLEKWSRLSVELFIGSVGAQLGPGSVHKHAMCLKMLERERTLTGAAVLLRDVLRVTSENWAQKTVQHSPDFPAFSDAIVSTLAIPNRLVRAAATCMCVLGLRHCDLVRISGGQIEVDIKVPRVRMDLHLTKNRRSPAKRIRVTLPKKALRNVPLQLLKLLQSVFSGAATALSSVTWQEVCDELREACIVEAMKETVTPGSLRRAFIHDKIELCTADDVTDWEAVRQWTAHCKCDTLIAYYQKDLPAIN
jgi:hypothetical protein